MFHPAKRSSAKLRLALRTRFPAFGDDLLQRRIGDEEIGQAAWRIFIGAGQFGRSRHAVAFRIARPQRQSVGQLIVELDAGIQPGDIIVSVNQVPVTTAKEVNRDVSRAEKSGRKSILLLVRRNGTQTFVAVPLGNA